MGLSQEQCDVYLYAVEVFERDCKAMDHTAHAHVQRSAARSGAPAELNWALDFLGCLPENRKTASRIDQAHRVCDNIDTLLSMSIDRFYARVAGKKLFNQGRFYLSLKK